MSKIPVYRTLYSNGAINWYKVSTHELHRDDGPAMIFKDSSQYWIQHGLIHRDSAPAIIKLNGNEFWYQYGKLHRVGAPAMISKNFLAWYHDNELHREDGPAAIYLEEPTCRAYFFRGKQYECNSDEEWIRKMRLKAFL